MNAIPFAVCYRVARKPRPIGCVKGVGASHGASQQHDATFDVWVRSSWARLFYQRQFDGMAEEHGGRGQGMQEHTKGSKLCMGHRRFDRWLTYNVGMGLPCHPAPPKARRGTAGSPAPECKAESGRCHRPLQAIARVGSKREGHWDRGGHDYHKRDPNPNTPIPTSVGVTLAMAPLALLICNVL